MLGISGRLCNCCKISCGSRIQIADLLGVDLLNLLFSVNRSALCR